MAPSDDRRIQLDIDAKEAAAKAVKAVEEAVESLGSEVTEAAGEMQIGDASAERLEDSLDEVGDEASQASVKLGALQTQLLGLQAFEGSDIDIPIDPDDIEDGSLSVADFRRQMQKLGDEVDDLGELDFMREMADELDDAPKAGRIFRQQLQKARASAFEDLDEDPEKALLDLDVDESTKDDLVRELNAAITEAEAGAQAVSARLDIPEGEKADLAGEAEAAVAAAESLVEDIDVDLDISMTDETVEFFELMIAMDAASASALKVVASMGAAEKSIDEAGDEATEAAGEMTLLASAANLLSLNTTALSLNVGAFNIALSNLATQIPILLALLGTLATAIIGVGGAALFAAGGIGAIFAGGAIAEVARVEEEFSNIEDTAQAMQAVMRSLMEVFREAIAPVTELNESTEIFFRTINGLLTAVNTFSKGIADSFRFSGQQMQEFIDIGKDMGIITDEMSPQEIDNRIMSIGELFNELGRIWNENIGDIVAGVKILSAFLFPVLADIIEFFVEGFDEMAIFVAHFTQELTAVAPALQQLLDFAVQLIDLGSTILQGLLPVIVGLLSIGTELARMMNGLNAQFVRNIAAVVALSFVTSRLTGGLIAFAKGIRTVVAGTLLMETATYAAVAAKKVMRGELAALTGATLVYRMVTWNLSRALASSTAAQWASVASTKALTASTWSLTEAYSAFTTVTGGLATLLPAIATAIVAIVAAGAAAVGVLGNMEGATSGLGSVLSGLKTVLSVIGNVLLNIFIAAWNGFIIQVEAAIAVVSGLIDLLMSVPIVGDAIAGTMSLIGTSIALAVEAFKNLPQHVNNFFDQIANRFEAFVNFFIRIMNELVPGLNMQEFDLGEPGREGSLTVTRSDVVSGAEDVASATGGLVGRPGANFNYTEENINETAVKVNADPEDKETMRRTVKDAMREADAFSRRHQGHGG